MAASGCSPQQSSDDDGGRPINSRATCARAAKALARLLGE
jgi:hypothetical protein